MSLCALTTSCATTIPSMGRGSAAATPSPISVPRGGRFLVLGSGPPSRLLGSARLDAKEAALLEQGVSVVQGKTTSDPREVDALLTRLVADLEG